jgi:hypothetical protein
VKKNLSLSLAVKLCVFGILIQLLHPAPAFAGGTVTVCDEGNLRAALVGGGLVTIACDGTIVLTNTLVITNNTTVNATGHNIILSGGNTVRLFLVNTGVTASFFNLTLANGRDVGVSNVNTFSQPGRGGAILNWGTVQLTGCSLISNSVAGEQGVTNSGTTYRGGDGLGGAIYNGAGNVFATNTSFIANSSAGGAGVIGGDNGSAGGDGFGGAIYNGGGNVTGSNVTFLANNSSGGTGGVGSNSFVPAAPNGGHAHGGAIFNSGGTLILNGVTLSANETVGGAVFPTNFGNPPPGTAGSGLGGALSSEGTSVELHGCVFNGNLAIGANLPFNTGLSGAGSGEGGAAFFTNGLVNCADCTFITNYVTAGTKARYGKAGLSQGGALWNHASLSVVRGNFFGNQAIGNGRGEGFKGTPGGDGNGGAIFTDTSLVLSESSFATNATRGASGDSVAGFNSSGGAGKGGAICSLGVLNTTNCTLVLNSATGGNGGNFGVGGAAAGGAGAGGGLFNFGTATLINLTLSSNRVDGGLGGNGGPPGTALGGGVYNTNGTLTLGNTLVAFSTSGSNCVGSLVDLGHNLSSDSSAGFSASGSLNNTDPKLGPLDFYGGPTPTLPLLAGSPAIDGGSTALAPATDQRGHTRPYGSASDIGAFESSPPFVIRGHVSGSTLSGEVNVVCESTNAITFKGNYSLEGLGTGPYTVTPSDSNYNFFPANRLISVGPDQVGVDFKAYRWNALSLESFSGGTLRLLFAGTNGLSYRVLFSTNLTDWIPVSTNVPVSSNLFEVLDPSVLSRPAGFYRTVQP